MARCTHCQAELHPKLLKEGSIVRCGRCKTYIDTRVIPRERGEIGIHPALARRYSIDSNESPKGREYSAKTISEQSLPQIPGYEVVECVGKGAMGSVYRAYYVATGRETALKVLSPELHTRADILARFEREIAALRAFRHPNVIQIFDNGAHAGLPYYGMEFIHGTTLRRAIRGGPLPLKKAIFYTRMILQGLAAAHGRGIIHRDLKPENVLVALGKDSFDQERVILVDFGLAGMADEGADPHPNLTRSKMTMGTVNYMAPEQHVDAKRVDHRTDLYACGVILYECLTGDLPLGRFMLPTERGVKVPKSVDDAIVRALARVLTERFQSAREFDMELAKIEEELKDVEDALQPAHSRSQMQTILPKFVRPATNSQLSTLVPKYRWLAIGVCALGLGIGMGFMVSSWQGRTSELRPDVPSKAELREHSISKKLAKKGEK